MPQLPRGSRWSHSGLPWLGAVTSLMSVCHSRHLRGLARRVGEPERGPTLSVRENAQRLSLSRFVAKPDRARSRPALPGKERGRGYPLDFGSDRIRSASLSPGAKDAESQIKVEVKLPPPEFESPCVTHRLLRTLTTQSSQYATIYHKIWTHHQVNVFRTGG